MMHTGYNTLNACGTSDGKEVTKNVFRCPGARVRVCLAHKKILAAHGIGCPAVGLNLETGQLSCHYIAEILLNKTLNHNKPNQTIDVQV